MKPETLDEFVNVKAIEAQRAWEEEARLAREADERYASAAELAKRSLLVSNAMAGLYNNLGGEETPATILDVSTATVRKVAINLGRVDTERLHGRKVALITPKYNQPGEFVEVSEADLEQGAMSVTIEFGFSDDENPEKAVLPPSGTEVYAASGIPQVIRDELEGAAALAQLEQNVIDTGVIALDTHAFILRAACDPDLNPDMASAAQAYATSLAEVSSPYQLPTTE